MKTYNEKQVENQDDEVQEMNNYEVAVVGGGMVGAAVALGFARQGRSVVLVEGAEPKAFDAAQPMDIRVSAISETSVALLRELGAWEDIAAMRVCPYRRLETWEHPECRTRFDAESMALEQLGYIIENRLIQLGLWQQFDQYDNLTVRCPDTLSDIEFGARNRVTLSSGETFDVEWVVGADGANSHVRQLAGIGVTAWDYRQHCMLISVETAKPQQDITWQQFTSAGPRSFLPLCGHQGSLVWYDSPQKIRQLSALNHDQLREQILTTFPPELGDVKVQGMGSFPLTRRHAQTYAQRGCVLVGDSAHTINPLAGQGVNLGFKDVAVLLDESDGHELEAVLLKRYERRRRPDNLLMQTGMDVFYKGFSNDLPPLKLLRNAALKLAEHSGPVKQQVLKYALGM
ncbi:2-octaprenyl-3-methyl-6-methoxy-1,4-benzoquinol hydroxylase [Vibrio proteolyticus NBRC 13287]|uniref:2-octaprenyl-3-methyl-6-methoxy-1,4-benzoquinol hydroxylase n=2 Tax=Vibrio proteolyticus TaxID=671 RepID=U3BGF7_VIBPR|nr:2-octaprenyl-3-methyl-6-methoxy-1,4-benzoquinol hydroxylase [Vibrio proteolyticus NBRC 13287]